jgi:hypothetical protein
MIKTNACKRMYPILMRGGGAGEGDVEHRSLRGGALWDALGGDRGGPNGRVAAEEARTALGGVMWRRRPGRTGGGRGGPDALGGVRW